MSTQQREVLRTMTYEELMVLLQQAREDTKKGCEVIFYKPTGCSDVLYEHACREHGLKPR